MPTEKLSIPQQWQQEQPTLEALSALSYRAGELQTYLHQIAVIVGQLLHLDWSIVTFGQNGCGRILASSIDIEEGANQVYSLHGLLAGTVIETGHSLVIEDAIACPNYGKIPEGYRAYLGVPLRTPIGEVIGTVCAFQRHPRQFTDEEVQLVEIFAERAATAIDNYQLYQQQQEFNEKLEAEVVKRTIELRATQAKLLAANQDLERRIAERTAELQAMNEQLQAEIDERRQAEEKLRQSEGQVRQIAENMRPVLWMYSAEGQPIYINPAFETVWQQSRESWLANPHCWDVIHPDDLDRVRKAFAQAAEQGYQEEYRIFHKDGSVRIIRDQAFPIRDESGQVYRIAGIAEDITEQKQAQQEKLRAIEALAEVGELAAMIVHEIRNPLTTVWMGLNSFKRMDLPEAAQVRLALSLDEADRLRNLLNEILLYAKPHTLQTEELDLNGWSQELLETIRTLSSVQQRRVQFIPAKRPAKVLADSSKLKQVLINLINNACEAVAAGETVTWQIESKPNQVSIRVHNGGEPIPSDILPKLTKPFYTTKSSGTGLGLAIVKRIVEAHGGELRIESSQSQGTMVSVILNPVSANVGLGLIR